MVSGKRYIRLAKESSWIIIGQIAFVSGALVMVRVLTEYLTPAEYGHLALGLTLASLVNQVVMGGITTGIGRFYSIAVEKQDLQGFLYESRRLLGYSTLTVLAMGMAIMAGLLWLGYIQWMGLAVSALVLSLLSAYNSSLSGIQNAARQRAIVAFHSGLDAWLKILLALGLMIWLGSSSTAVLIGYALSSLLVTGSQLFFLRWLISPLSTKRAETTPWAKQIWDFSWPFSAWGIFTWAQLVSDRWALEIFTTTREVGLYAVLFQLGYYPMSLATELSMQFLAPIFYRRAGDANNNLRIDNLNKLSWHLVALTLGLTFSAFLFAFLFHTQIFFIFVAKEYVTMSNLLPWMFLSGGLFAAGQTMALNLMSQMKTVTIMTVKVVTALLGMILNFLGAYWYGTMGVVIAGVLFSIIYFGWMATLSKAAAEKVRVCEDIACAG